MKSDIFETIKNYEEKASKIIIDAKTECKELVQQFETQKGDIEKKYRKEFLQIKAANEQKFNVFNKDIQKKYDEKFDSFSNQMNKKYSNELPSIKDLFNKELIVKKINWISGRPPKLPLKVKVKIRYRHKAVSAKIIEKNKKYEVQ